MRAARSNRLAAALSGLLASVACSEQPARPETEGGIEAEGGAEASSGDDSSGEENHAIEDGRSEEADEPPLPRQLFNGRDFSGWETYLGPPYGSTEPIGQNRDPMGVFSIVTVDGAPAIRISGEIWGALSTVDEFADYHLRAEFKWGTLPVWPPLTVRDSGLLYHSVGPFGAVKAGGGALADPPLSGYFMTSLELQIAQGDVGSCYSLGPVSFDGGAVSRAAVEQYENAVGAWNVVDVFVLGGESVHEVNGHPVVHIADATRPAEDGGRLPLTRGKIQLQSESMEIFFRNVSIEPIDRIPAGDL